MASTYLDKADAVFVRSRPRVVLIEDDPEMAQALRHVLERGGYDVSPFDNARDALSALRDQHAPDLIVLDLWTPNMNGWEFRLAQRQDEKLARVPLIAMSADRSPHAAAIDADRFLAKPVTGPALLRCVEELLARPRAQLDVSGLTADSWNALFMILTDLRDGRVHARTLASELDGFEAARTVALEVLLERAESCARRALGYCDQMQPAAPSAAPAYHSALQFQDLDSFLGAYDPEPTQARTGATYEGSRMPRADLLAVLAHCLRTYPDVPPNLHFELTSAALTPVRAEPELLARLLRNLLRNAFEALAGAPRPELFVHARQRQDFVELALSDSGRGVRMRELERAFDPFFSTKRDRPGLGLTVARRIAVRMDGRIDLDRGPGGGTVACLVLRSAEREEAPASAPITSRPRVLIVNEGERAQPIKHALQDEFHVVVMGAESALQHLLSEVRYDLVLCALVLPGMTGISFVSALAMTNPVQSRRLVMMIPPQFGPETPKLLDQLHLWHVDEGDAAGALATQLKGLLRLWRDLHFR